MTSTIEKNGIKDISYRLGIHEQFSVIKWVNKDGKPYTLYVDTNSTEVINPTGQYRYSFERGSYSEGKYPNCTYHHSRELDHEAKSNKSIVNDMMKLVRESGMIEEAKQFRDEAEAAEFQKNKAHHDRCRLNESAPAMLEALKIFAGWNTDFESDQFTTTKEIRRIAQAAIDKIES